MNSAKLNQAQTFPDVQYITEDFIRAVHTSRDARIIAIFPAGNDIDLQHRLTIIIFNIFFKLQSRLD